MASITNASSKKAGSAGKEKPSSKQDSKQGGKRGYGSFAKEYGLPDESQLAVVFDVDPLDKEDLPLREVIKKIADRLDWIAQILEGVIQPEHLAGLTEADTLSDAARKGAHALYSDVMFLLRESQLQILHGDSARHAAFIKDSWAGYGRMLPQLESILVAMRDSWKGASGTVARKAGAQDRGSAGYFG